jgi:hypothetical protein
MMRVLGRTGISQALTCSRAFTTVLSDTGGESTGTIAPEDEHAAGAGTSSAAEDGRARKATQLTSSIASTCGRSAAVAVT